MTSTTPTGQGFRRISSRFLGPWSRYCLTKNTDRFGNTCYFVTDAEQVDEYGMSKVIRQTETEQLALAGLI